MRSIIILNLYMLVDTVLTAYGLNLGLHEVNPFVPTGKLALHFLVISVIMGLSFIGAHLIARRISHAAWGITRIVVLLITFFYVFVLVNNVVMVWRVTHT